MKSSSRFLYSDENSPGLGLTMLDPTLHTELNTSIQPVSPTIPRRPTLSISPGLPRRIRKPLLPTLPRIKPPKVTPAVRDLTQPATTNSETVATQKKPLNTKMIALAGAGIVGAGILLKILR